jgi:hypothetical protein
LTISGYEHGIAMLTSLGCGAFQAFLLLNYFTTKSLVNVSFFKKENKCPLPGHGKEK